MNGSEVLREQLLALLRGGHAHMPFEQVVSGFPERLMNERAPNFPHTPWQLLEHLRIAQWDILEFIRNPAYESPPWPEGYWPTKGERADLQKWENTTARFFADRQALEEIVADESTDLTAPLPHAADYNILREILVVSDHNAYHLGEMATLKTVLGA